MSDCLALDYNSFLELIHSPLNSGITLTSCFFFFLLTFITKQPLIPSCLLLWELFILAQLLTFPLHPFPPVSQICAY